MARFHLTPQKREFFDLFTQASANAREIARLLVELLDGWPESRERLRRHPRGRARGRPADARGDQPPQPHLRHAVRPRRHVPARDGDRRRLRPRRRGGRQHRRSTRCATCPTRAQEQADVVYRAASRLHEAVELLEGFGDSQRQLSRCASSRTRATGSSREAIADLFRSGQDPLTIIRWKDIHEQIEEAVDACENAADVLEAILVKNR